MDPDQKTSLYGEVGAELTVTSYDLPGAELLSVTGLFEDPSAWYDALLDEIPFSQEQSFVHGKLHEQPRLTALLGTHYYTYSGKKRIPLPWGPNMLVLRDYIESITAQLQPERAAKYPDAFKYHSAITNLYTSGADHIGHHADKAPELIPEGYIASLTFLEADEPRYFDLYPQVRDEKTGRLKKGPRALRLEPKSGELLLCGPGVQENYYHELPSQKRITTGRINLTFRPLHPWAILKE